MEQNPSEMTILIFFVSNYYLKRMDAMLKRMCKGVPLTTREPLKVDQVVLERQFVFRLEIAPIECGIIRRKTIRHIGVVETANGLADRLEIGKRAGLKIGTGAQFKTDAPMTKARQ